MSEVSREVRILNLQAILALSRVIRLHLSRREWEHLGAQVLDLLMQVVLDREFREHVLQNFAPDVFQGVLQDGVLVAVQRGADALDIVFGCHREMRRMISSRGNRHSVVVGSKRIS